MHKELTKLIFERFNASDKEFLENKFIYMIDLLKELDHREYEKIESCLYVHMYGEHLSKEMAENWTHNMKNKDGSEGAHWTIAETNDIAKKYGIEFKDFSEQEWFAVLNMIYSDYYGIISNDISTYVELAKGWFYDKDSDTGKTYRYYMNVVKID